MGYNIGIRLIDEFLAKSNVTRCVNFRETAEVIAKVQLSSLLDNLSTFLESLWVTASVTNWDQEGTCCSLILEDNPLVDFVELPDTYQGLYYCNILSGFVKGALEMDKEEERGQNLHYAILYFDFDLFLKMGLGCHK
ncbi:hypothetical protein L2E82_07800 [Cichorium intybus]|uniref:Uncharacterized protein n=1 Tax=Cichorium intybus TaxID=13427 RepID=A0ACB9G4K5_CICIN|nr:hypothetical protein L2E82_07800 [Cichorium intybus]